jgi:hypothetical protein
MNIITYNARQFTFKTESKEEAARVLRRCEIAQGQLTAEPLEGGPRLMSVDEYLVAEHLNSLDGVTFDDPAYL